MRGEGRDEARVGVEVRVERRLVNIPTRCKGPATLQGPGLCHVPGISVGRRVLGVARQTNSTIKFFSDEAPCGINFSPRQRPARPLISAWATEGGMRLRRGLAREKMCGEKCAGKNKAPKNRFTAGIPYAAPPRPPPPSSSLLLVH